jgi:hypothetical protein
MNYQPGFSTFTDNSLSLGTTSLKPVIHENKTIFCRYPLLY